MLEPPQNYKHQKQTANWQKTNIMHYCTKCCGPGSSVGIATDYELDGPGSNPGGDEIFRPSRPALGPTQPPVKWAPGSFPGVKCGRGVLLTTHPLLVPRSTHLLGHTGPVTWSIYLYFYLFLFLWRCGPTRSMASSFLRFLDYTQRRITVTRTPLHERSARRRHLYLTTHNTYNRQTSMPRWDSNTRSQ